MESLQQQACRVWNAFKSIPQMVQGYFRERLGQDHLPRNNELTQQTSNIESQISKEAILVLSRDYNPTLSCRLATMDKAYEILTNFGCQIRDLDGSSNSRGNNLLLQSWLEIFCNLLALVDTVCCQNVSNDITNNRKKLKIYCKTWQTLFKVRYEIRWVTCLLVDILGRNSGAGGYILDMVSSTVPVIDFEIKRYIRISLLHVYESELRTFKEDFLVDMIQCLDMHKEEIDESILPYVVRLRGRLTLLVQHELGSFLPVQKLCLDSLVNRCPE